MIYIWDVATGQHLTALELNQPDQAGSVVSILAFPPNGLELAPHHLNRKVCLWNISTHHCRILEYQQHFSLSALAFNSDGTKFATTYHTSLIRLWNIATGELLITFSDPAYIYSSYNIAFHPDGLHLAICSNKIEIRAWNMMTKQYSSAMQTQIDESERNSLRFPFIAFHPNGHLLATSKLTNIYVCDHSKKADSTVILTAHEEIRSLVFLPDNYLLATIYEHRTIRLWNVNTSECVATLRTFSQPCCIYPTKKDEIVTVLADGDIQHWGFDDTEKKWMLTQSLKNRTRSPSLCLEGTDFQNTNLSLMNRRLAEQRGSVNVTSNNSSFFNSKKSEIQSIAVSISKNNFLG